MLLLWDSSVPPVQGELGGSGHVLPMHRESGVMPSLPVESFGMGQGWKSILTSAVLEKEFRVWLYVYQNHFTSERIYGAT